MYLFNCSNPAKWSLRTSFYVYDYASNMYITVYNVAMVSNI